MLLGKASDDTPGNSACISGVMFEKIDITTAVEIEKADKKL